MLQIIYTMSSSDQILIPLECSKKFTPQIFQLYRFLKEQFSTYDASQNPSPSIIRHAKLLRNWEGKVTSTCNRIILLYYTGVIPVLHGFFLTFWSQQISRMKRKKNDKNITIAIFSNFLKFSFFAWFHHDIITEATCR